MKINAHIPTQQYGYIEVTDLPDDPKVIQEVYNKYAEKPINLTHVEALGSTNDDFVELEAYVGGKIWYSDSRHEYRNDKGEVYLSGSQYASQFDRPFDARSIAGKMSDKSGVPAQDILKMWEMKRDISNGYGTALHLAMQLYGEYHKHKEAFDKNYHIHDLSVFKDATESFYRDRHDEEAVYEALVVDHARKYAGRIDRLAKSKTGWFVEDFKTNAELDPKKLAVYWKQLSFYASILKAGGAPVVGLTIHHWDGVKWTSINSEVQEVK